VFLELLGKHATCSRERLDALCEEFIALDVSTAADQFSPIPGARETLVRAHALGYRLVVATNPVFPLSAVKLRMKWGGVDDIPFERITSSQTMTRCKPHPDYYRQLLAQLGVRGGECLMIGNDPKKDLPAKDVGCYTYILDLPAVRPQEARLLADPRLDGYGSYEDLQAWLERSRKTTP
jgi:FMN phosphatase YigB (HAD superfamily)